MAKNDKIKKPFTASIVKASVGVNGTGVITMQNFSVTTLTQTIELLKLIVAG